MRKKSGGHTRPRVVRRVRRDVHQMGRVAMYRLACSVLLACSTNVLSTLTVCACVCIGLIAVMSSFLFYLCPWERETSYFIWYASHRSKRKRDDASGKCAAVSSSLTDAAWVSAPLGALTHTNAPVFCVHCSSWCGVIYLEITCKFA